MLCCDWFFNNTSITVILMLVLVSLAPGIFYLPFLTKLFFSFRSTTISVRHGSRWLGCMTDQISFHQMCTYGLPFPCSMWKVDACFSTMETVLAHHRYPNKSLFQLATHLVCPLLRTRQIIYHMIWRRHTDSTVELRYTKTFTHALKIATLRSGILMCGLASK